MSLELAIQASESACKWYGFNLLWRSNVIGTKADLAYEGAVSVSISFGDLMSLEQRRSR